MQDHIKILDENKKMKIFKKNSCCYLGRKRSGNNMEFCKGKVK